MQCLILLVIRLRKIRSLFGDWRLKEWCDFDWLYENCKERQVIPFFCQAAANAENFKYCLKKKKRLQSLSLKHQCDKL